MYLTDYLSLTVFELFYTLSFCLVIYSVLCNCFVILSCSVVFVLYVCLRVFRWKTTGQIGILGQGVFITGCDTGFGHDLSLRLDDLGFTVFAGCLNPDGDGARQLKYGSSKSLHIVPLDVCKDDSVKQAHDYVVKHLPKSGLWALVNNAGIYAVGDVELCTMRQYQSAMDVNFFGALRTLKTFIHLVRESSGRVVIVSSCKGRFSWAGDSAYHATKFALETVSDSLRLEMLKFGVKVAIVEPGVFCNVTGIQSDQQIHMIKSELYFFTAGSLQSKRFRMEVEEMWVNASKETKHAYGRDYLESSADAIDSVRHLSARSTSKVIDAMVDAIISERPETRYTVGGGSGWFDVYMNLGRCYGFLPTWLSDWFIVKWTKCDQSPAFFKKHHKKRH